MAVAIPEKTYEHWVSSYLLNRYPHATLWWPVAGADIEAIIRSMATTNGPGKLLHLELKTAVWDGSLAVGRHRVLIDTAQLGRYLKADTPTYYVFPVPFWSGSVGATGAPGASQPAYSWWRRRTAAGVWHAEWFGNWTYVLSAVEVQTWLGARIGQANPSLFSELPNALPQSVGLFGGPTMRPPALSAGVTPWHWRAFWREVEECGPIDGTRLRVYSDGALRRLPPGSREPSETLSLDEDQIRGLTPQEPGAWDGGTRSVVIHLPSRHLRGAARPG